MAAFFLLFRSPFPVPRILTYVKGMAKIGFSFRSAEELSQ